VSNREQVQAALAAVLLEHVRQDQFPSATQMDIIEQTIPPQLYAQYLDALLEKIVSDTYPSIPMIRRIQRFADHV
jgi:hypothetical protein